MVRKFLSILIVILLVGVLSACNGKTLNAKEQLVLDYINIFNNGTDKEAKNKFVEENCLPESKPLFLLALKVNNQKERILKDPEVLESIDLEDSEKKGTAVLVKGKNSDGIDSERIVVFIGDKMGMELFPNAKDENKNYEKLRSAFKTPIEQT
ncbi:hypothetical protein ERICI_01920 [Paenibacillus larvae subsp. larvae]|nr:hypothetical protein ERICI_01920 [Paenibacillus larvae subsp. larvae]ETK27522.1 hypothetical protein ERIC1_1c09680 [Paenibacillus larvae subsp. larvae DSM 25719]